MVVYQHKRNDTNEIFYIGIATRKDRPFSKGLGDRSELWHRTVNKANGRTVEIIHNGSESECKYLEGYLISYYGRRDLNQGTLVNMTDGGEGSYNWSQERRDIYRNRMLGKQIALGYNHTDDAKEKIRQAQIGRKHSDENISKMRINKGGTSQFRGVSLNKISKKYSARIRYNGKKLYLGTFDVELDAHYAYENKLKELNQ